MSNPSAREALAELIAAWDTFNGKSIPESLHMAIRNARAALAAAPAEPPKLRDAAQAFLKKYDALMPAVNDAFVFQHVHGGEYKGDTWGAEIDALRLAVASPNAAPAGEPQNGVIMTTTASGYAYPERKTTAPPKDGEVAALREMLAFAYAGALLYHDDGELQDNKELPFIDFRRDSVDEIEAKMLQRTAKAWNRLQAEQSTPPTEVAALIERAREAVRNGAINHKLLTALADALARLSAPVPDPIPMVLHCPQCSRQHIDAPQPEKDWTNPPHRSHECQFCGFVWRPADVPTTGVQATQTHGSRDAAPVPAREWNPDTPKHRPSCASLEPYPFSAKCDCGAVK